MRTIIKIVRWMNIVGGLFFIALGVGVGDIQMLTGGVVFIFYAVFVCPMMIRWLEAAKGKSS